MTSSVFSSKRNFFNDLFVYGCDIMLGVFDLDWEILSYPDFDISWFDESL